MKPLVSIIIPVYNGENYLKEAIDSALNQTYSPVEVIVVNDGSRDRTEEIALSYCDQIRYFSKENGGVSTALNMGIANMQGEYFSWLSHDDLYVPDKIAVQITMLADSPTGIVYSSYTVIDKDGKKIAEMDISKKYPDTDLTLGLFPILRQTLNGCSLLIHKSHFVRVGMFNESLRVTQDYDLWFKMFRGVRLAYVSKPLVMMREHGAQVTHNYERTCAESDELWLSMLEKITSDEACELYGTELAFWENQMYFLLYTPYTKAKAYAKSRMNTLGRSGGLPPSAWIRLAMYKILSKLSHLTRVLGIQKAVRASRIFHLGYRIWLKIRYK